MTNNTMFTEVYKVKIGAPGVAVPVAAWAGPLGTPGGCVLPATLQGASHSTIQHVSVSTHTSNSCNKHILIKI